MTVGLFEERTCTSPEDDYRHRTKIQSYGTCINCGRLVGEDVAPIKLPVRGTADGGFEVSL